MNRLIEIAATGDVGDAVGSSLRSVTLTAAAATATLVLREGGAAGTVRLSLSAAATTSVQWCGDVDFSGQLHATLGGAGALAYVEV